MSRTRFSRDLLPLWLILIGVGTLDIFLMLWTPTGDSYKSPWAVPLVSGFFLLLLAIVLSGRSDQSLGRQIQATASAAPPPSVETTRPSQAIQDVRPVPDFSIDVLTTQNLPTLSPDAAVIVERGRRLYSERLRIYRRGVWLVGLAHLAVALVGRALDRPYPIPFVVWSWLVVGIAGLVVLCPPTRRRLILAPVAWRIVNLACVALTAIAAVLFAMRAIEAGDPRSALLAVVMVAVVTGHAWWLRNRNRDLRRKVMADAPLKLVFLWVFGSYTPVFLFLGFAAVWRFLGRMQLLNGAGFMGDTLVIATSFVRGKSSDLVVKTPEELAARIAAFTAVPGAMGMYAHHALLCHDSVWKLALDTALKDSDVILMDLRGFSREHQGATYELGQLIDRVPVARFVLLADNTTDAEFLSATLRRSWEAMAIESPNRRTPSRPIRVFHLEQASTKRGEFPQLPAIAREGDRLLEILCECAAGVTR